MKKQVGKGFLFQYGVIVCLAVAAWVLLKTGGGFHAALSFLKNMETSMENQKEGAGGFTSMEFRYKEKFQGTLGRYRYFASLYQEENSTPVPGLASTDVLGTPCTQMVPQGICIACLCSWQSIRSARRR